MEDSKINYGITTAITSWEEAERPREKLALWGKNAVTLTELLAIVIGSGNRNLNAVELSRLILQKHSPEKLPFLKIHDLTKFKGIGHAKAVSIIAALELGKRCLVAEKEIPAQIVTSADVYRLLRDTFANLDHEQFWVIFLNTNGRVIAKEMISKGGISQTVVDPIIVMKKTIGYMAKGIVLAHNHPSGNMEVSRADKTITNKIAELCKLLHVNLCDHVIFTSNGYTSFADIGLLKT